MEAKIPLDRGRCGNPLQPLLDMQIKAIWIIKDILHFFQNVHFIAQLPTIARPDASFKKVAVERQPMPFRHECRYQTC